MKLTVKEYAKNNGISEQAVRKRIKSGSILAERNGKSWEIMSNETKSNQTKPIAKHNETENNHTKLDTKPNETKKNQAKPVTKPNETENNHAKPNETEINKDLKSIKQQGHETQSNVLALYKNDKAFIKELQEIKDEHSKSINRISKSHQIQIVSIIIAVIIGAFLLLLQYQKSQDISLEREKSLQDAAVKQKDDFQQKESELKTEIKSIDQELKKNVNTHSETKIKLAVLENQHQVTESEKQRLAEEKAEIEIERKKLQEEVITLKLKLLQQAAVPSGNLNTTSSDNIAL
jgi:hypothetical protein